MTHKHSLDKIGEVETEVRRTWKHGRYAVENGIDELIHTVRQRPFRSLAAAFMSGLTLGLVVRRRTGKPGSAGDSTLS